MKSVKNNDSKRTLDSLLYGCRQNRQDLIEETLDKLDVSCEETLKTVSDALGYELPKDLHDSILPPLLEKGPEHARIAARVCAFQHLDFETECTKALTTDPTEKTTVLALLHALGRISLSMAAVVTLVPFLTHEDKEIAQAAIHTLIRTGETRQLSPIPKTSWPVMGLALSQDLDAYAEILSHPDPEQDKTLALGILGNIRAVPELIFRLGDLELAENAALSLFMITGAELYEDHVIPGEESGETISRISQSQKTWQAFWDENQADFNADERYRNGKPFAPESLIDTLKSEKSPDLIRRLSYEELVIRFNIDTPFETDMTVKDQLAAIEAMEKQIRPVSMGLDCWDE